MQDVIGAHAWHESGQLAFWIGNDPPNHLVEALHVFRTALTRARYELRQEKKKDDEA